MSFLELAEQRYSVRKFADQPVEEEKIQAILNAAHIAPTACNNQPFRIFVFQSKEGLEIANRLSPMLYGAPLVFMICYDMSRQAMVSLNELNFGLIDASIVTTHMMLEAAEQGLGSCWIGRFDTALACTELNLPDEIEPMAMLPVGYADMPASPRHTEYRDLAELVTRL